MRLYHTDSRPSHLGMVGQPTHLAGLGHALDPDTVSRMKAQMANGLTDAQIASNFEVGQIVVAEVRAELGASSGSSTDWGAVAAGIFQTAAPVGTALAQQQGWLPRGQTAINYGQAQPQSSIPWVPIIVGLAVLGGLYAVTR